MGGGCQAGELLLRVLGERREGKIRSWVNVGDWELFEGGRPGFLY